MSPIEGFAVCVYNGLKVDVGVSGMPTTPLRRLRDIDTDIADTRGNKHRRWRKAYRDKRKIACCIGNRTSRRCHFPKHRWTSFVSTVMGVSYPTKRYQRSSNLPARTPFSYVPVRKYFAISCIDFNQDANESP